MTSRSVVSAMVFCTILSTIAITSAAAQAPAPAANKAAPGNCACAGPAQHLTAEDLRLRTVYNAEDAWRKAQRGAGDENHPDQVTAELPSVDAATQQADL
ncbi:MAG: hypothetical protein WB439_16130, partial [Acidobacteriaceae bacterium]